MPAQAVPNKSTTYEENGKPITNHKGFLYMHHEYDMTVILQTTFPSPHQSPTAELIS